MLKTKITVGYFLSAVQNTYVNYTVLDRNECGDANIANYTTGNREDYFGNF